MKDTNLEVEQMLDLIMEDLEGAIKPEDRQLLEIWRGSKASNEKLYQDFLKVQLNLNKIYNRYGYETQSSWETLSEKLDDKKVVRTPTLKFYSSSWFRIAAILVLISSIGFYFIQNSNNNVVISTDGSLKTTFVALPDGTEISLNSGTTIRYSKKDFLADRKLELLNGEVFINVVNHNGSRFKVDLGKVEAQDIGTRFNIFRNDEKVEINVESGSVALKKLATNEKLTLDKQTSGGYNFKNQQLKANLKVVHNYKAWLDKKFVFEEVGVEEVAHQLQKTYKYPILVRGNLKQRKLTALLHYQTLDSALAVISASLQCKLIKENNTYVLSDK
jgi:transmembrane sensor